MDGEILICVLQGFGCMVKRVSGDSIGHVACNEATHTEHVGWIAFSDATFSVQMALK